MAKRNFFNSNKWDSSKDILEREYKIDSLKRYTRTKRKYELVNPIQLIGIIATHFRQKDYHYWKDGGIEESRSKRQRISVAT